MATRVAESRCAYRTTVTTGCAAAVVRAVTSPEIAQPALQVLQGAMIKPLVRGHHRKQLASHLHALRYWSKTTLRAQAKQKTVAVTSRSPVLARMTKYHRRVRRPVPQIQSASIAHVSVGHAKVNYLTGSRARITVSACLITAEMASVATDRAVIAVV